jgi:cytochrome oxidase assembly protein ShyY1
MFDLNDTNTQLLIAALIILLILVVWQMKRGCNGKKKSGLATAANYSQEIEVIT